MEKEKLVSRVTLLMYCYVHQFWGQPPWLLIQVLSLTIFLIWGKVINHSVSQFLIHHLWAHNIC